MINHMKINKPCQSNFFYLFKNTSSIEIIVQYKPYRTVEVRTEPGSLVQIIIDIE